MYQKWLTTILTFLFLFIFKVESQLNGTCITPNNQNARCISIYECKVFLAVIKTGTASQRKYMKESLCGLYRDVPIVCCGSDSDYSTQPKRPKRETEFKKNPALSDTDCGKSVENKLSGRLVVKHEYPWTVRLAYNKTLKFACEGVLINKRYILTAGLCLDETAFQRVGRLAKVRLGEYNCLPGDDKCNNTDFIEVGVEDVIPHKDYGHIRNVNHDDIGLVRLDKDIVFSDEISPICLPNPGEVAKAGDAVVEIGWYKNSPEKLKAPITIISKEKCNESYEKLQIKVTDTQMCAGGYADRNCAGSAGGSLASKRTTGNLAWILQGIISFGPNICGASDIPSVYTKVESYLQWIHDNVKN